MLRTLLFVALLPGVAHAACDPTLPPLQLLQCTAVQADTTARQVAVLAQRQQQLLAEVQGLRSRVAALEARADDDALRLASVEADVAELDARADDDALRLTSLEADVAEVLPIADVVTFDGPDVHIDAAGRLYLESVVGTEVRSDASVVVSSAINQIRGQTLADTVIPASILSPGDLVGAGVSLAGLAGRVAALEARP